MSPGAGRDVGFLGPTAGAPRLWPRPAPARRGALLQPPGPNLAARAKVVPALPVPWGGLRRRLLGPSLPQTALHGEGCARRAPSVALRTARLPLLCPLPAPVAVLLVLRQPAEQAGGVRLHRPRPCRPRIEAADELLPTSCPGRARGALRRLVEQRLRVLPIFAAAAGPEIKAGGQARKARSTSLLTLVRRRTRLLARLDSLSGPRVPCRPFPAGGPPQPTPRPRPRRMCAASAQRGLRRLRLSAGGVRRHLLARLRVLCPVPPAPVPAALWRRIARLVVA